MAVINTTTSGDFNKTERFLKKMRAGDHLKQLDSLGRQGVAALSTATPMRSGKTASSWNFEVHQSKGRYEIDWTNSNVNDGVNIAVIIQYGHGTRNGGYVQGRDYINPAMRPVFDSIADAAWKVVISA